MSPILRALRDRIGYGENLRRLLVEQQVIIAKVAPTDMPVKILRLHIKREQVRELSAQVARYLLDRIPVEIRRSFFVIFLCHCQPPFAY